VPGQVDHNLLALNYRDPLPRPKVRGAVIDAHCHLFARRHAKSWFEAADHFGIDHFVTQTPLEEAIGLSRQWGHRLVFVAVPKYDENKQKRFDTWLRRLDAFANLGAKMAKIHMAPQTMQRWGWQLNSPEIRRIIHEIRARGMIIMTHIGDPTHWYNTKYADRSVYGSRDEHYQWWEDALEEHRGWPWWCAHLGGNPEDLPRIQRLLDRFPDLILDLSATRWMVREISARRDEAREFIIRNVDRLIWGSDQVSGDARDFDFLASRFWCHRKLFETAYHGQSPILDPDFPLDAQPVLHGLALPDDTLQKLYRDNAIRVFAKMGVHFGPMQIAA